MADNSSPIAPLNPFPERVTNVWEAKMAPNASGGRGPMYFEEGVATDTDVPSEMSTGIQSGYAQGPRPNMNAIVWYKRPDETMRERAHIGSAAWVEAPEYLGAFAGGTSNEAERLFIQVSRGQGLGQKWHRQDAAVVQD